ncbi:MAG: ANTAR domain-containing response regulator [Gammaproteobacteria bacterium]
MRVMLVDDDERRATLLAQTLCAAGHQLVARVSTRDALLAEVAAHQPDIVLIDVDAPSRDTLESLSAISRERPRPIVLFANTGDAQTIRRALRAGVSAYVVDGLSAARLQPVIEVAIARFEEFQSLRHELEDARLKLADRRDVEKAKGLLMKRRGLDEPAAHELLRRMAMDRNLRIGDAARALLAAAELL